MCIRDRPILALEHVNMQGGCVDTNSQQVSCTDLTDLVPLFVDEAGGDYRLQESSPLIDAGDTTLMPDDLFDLNNDQMSSGQAWPYDFDGAARVSGAEVDLGPYESAGN